MKAILETNFVINLDIIGKLSLLSEMKSKLGWTFHLPGRVRDELSESRPLNPNLLSLINDGHVEEETCVDYQYDIIKARYSNLGKGEIDAICVVNDCEDKTFLDYVILTDDNIAINRAKDIGITSLRLLPFIAHANKIGLISKNEAIGYLEELKSHRFTPKQVVCDAFEKALI